MNKVCSSCKEAKSLDQFGGNRNAKDGKSWYCFVCTNKHKRERRINVTYKEVFEKYNHKCANCGSTENLQVHHLAEKSKEGLDQLILLCKKCHYTTAHPGQWKLKATLLHCKRCWHSWYPKQPEVRICPKCKSAYWDKKRKNA